MLETGLKDKVVIVTGANHGVGAATAIAFAKEGAKVFITYYRFSAEGSGSVSQEDADAATEPGRAYYYKAQTSTADNVVKAIQKIGGKCFAWEADLSDTGNIPKLFDMAEEKLGPVDVLVNNAAYCKGDTFIPKSQTEQAMFLDEYPCKTITGESHDDHFAVNSRAVALTMAEYGKRYIARKASSGRIVNISSDGASGHAYAVSYGAGKSAMESFSRAAAQEFGPYGITVNVLSLGAVQTGWLRPEVAKSIAESYPLRRLGEPEDVADVAVFFASEQARWITGQVLFVGGGNKM
jgi:3-oxoacyl-[acyl-carrier protein] reductase